MSNTTIPWRLSYHTNQGSHKGVCPQCGKRSLSLYVDSSNNVIAEGLCGRCDHETTCGYHYTPKQYYNDHPGEQQRVAAPAEPGALVDQYTPIPFCIIEKLKRRIDFADYKYQPECAAIHKCGLYPKLAKVAVKNSKLLEVLDAYHIGFTLKGGIVYPTIKTSGEVTSAKVMWYDQDGHRTQYASTIHALMKKHGLMSEDARQRSCLFGEHLLEKNPGKEVCIVESEKTALLMALYEPGKLWLATGSLNTINLLMKAPLQGREVLLYPDKDGIDVWTRKAASMDLDAKIVNWWEGYNVGEKWDIADLYDMIIDNSINDL